MMSAVITAMRKFIRGRLSPTRKGLGIKCLLRIISLSVITGPRVMLPGRSQKRELRRPLTLTKHSRNRNKNKACPAAAVTIQEDENDDQTSDEEEDDNITAVFSTIFNNNWI
eukprot:14859915-Ditylum_brightwellii.AAC.1